MQGKEKSGLLVAVNGEGWRSVITGLAMPVYGRIVIANEMAEVERLIVETPVQRIIASLHWEYLPRNQRWKNRGVEDLIQTATENGVPPGEIGIYFAGPSNETILDPVKAMYPGVNYFDIDRNFNEMRMFILGQDLEKKQ